MGLGGRWDGGGGGCCSVWVSRLRSRLDSVHWKSGSGTSPSISERQMLTSGPTGVPKGSRAPTAGDQSSMPV